MDTTELAGRPGTKDVQSHPVRCACGGTDRTPNHICEFSKPGPGDPERARLNAVSLALSALETGAPFTQRAAAWNALRDAFFPVLKS